MKLNTKILIFADSAIVGRMAIIYAVSQLLHNQPREEYQNFKVEFIHFIRDI